MTRASQPKEALTEGPKSKPGIASGRNFYTAAPSSVTNDDATFMTAPDIASRNLHEQSHFTLSLCRR